MKQTLYILTIITTLAAVLTGCARMGAPDGGWYDEKPPYVVDASPSEYGTNAKSRKVTIYFNENIKLENASEKVVISPLQLQQPEIKATGKRITVQLLDSLKPNTTYSIDFSDAISDNNEGNPMGNYTYTFSTGDYIDTLECSGYVLNAEDLEPVKGILVGLIHKDSVIDSLPMLKNPFLRVSRTDANGHFVVRGIAPGTYIAGALQDMDGDMVFSQRAELMAFSHREITPSSFLDHRQDTLWLDELHIKDIKVVPYTHFMPDDIVLRSFQHEVTARYFLKYDRDNADHFTLYFTAPLTEDSLKRFNDPTLTILPQVRLLNATAQLEEFAEPTLRGDTVTYWLRDTALVNQDTLVVEMKTLCTDTLNTLQYYTDTLEILAKKPYAKRMKEKAQQQENWQKDLEKRLKQREKQLARMEDEEQKARLEPIDTVMPPEVVSPDYDIKSSMDPDGTIYIHFAAPMARVDTAAVHLYVERDSLWFRAPMVMRQTDSLTTKRNWEVFTEWIPGAEYSFEVDSCAFEDIYGHTSNPYVSGIKVKEIKEYASLFVNVTAPDHEGDILVQLLDEGGKVKRTVKAEKSTAEFYYVTPATYYLRAIIDRNKNGHWDTGDYYMDIQPEEVYYFNEPIECKAKWDLTKAWNLTSRPLYKQKPEKMIKQKSDTKKTQKHRNLDRARQKGIPLPEELK